jgi:hypothetical protein
MSTAHGHRLHAVRLRLACGSNGAQPMTSYPSTFSPPRKPVEVTSLRSRKGDFDVFSVSFPNTELLSVSEEFPSCSAGLEVAYSQPDGTVLSYWYEASSPEGTVTDVTDVLLAPVLGAIYEISYEINDGVGRARNCERVHRRLDIGAPVLMERVIVSEQEGDAAAACEEVSVLTCPPNTHRWYHVDVCCHPGEGWSEATGCKPLATHCISGPFTETGCFWGPIDIGERLTDSRSSTLGVLKHVPTGRYYSQPLMGEKQVEQTVSSFFIMESEVTQAMWVSQMGGEAECPDCPMHSVDQGQIRLFIEGINDSEEAHYRLPSRSEWEWAAMGGDTFVFAGSDDIDSVAWHRGNTDRIRPVCELARNGFGLCDMSGNVWERTVPPRHGSLDNEHTAKRGGSWFAWPNDARIFVSGEVSSHTANDGLGFRLLRE